jgi:hypothetical protein
VFGHIGDEISKNGGGGKKKRYTGLQGGHETQFTTKFGFSERFQPITAAALCTVAINVLEPGAFNAESQYFIPLFNKIS